MRPAARLPRSTSAGSRAGLVTAASGLGLGTAVQAAGSVLKTMLLGCSAAPEPQPAPTRNAESIRPRRSGHIRRDGCGIFGLLRYLAALRKGWGGVEAHGAFSPALGAEGDPCFWTRCPEQGGRGARGRGALGSRAGGRSLRSPDERCAAVAPWPQLLVPVFLVGLAGELIWAGNHPGGEKKEKI